MDKELIAGILGPKPEEEKSEDDHLRVIARELIESVHAKDTDGVVDSLKAAFECLEQREDQYEGESEG